MPDHFKTARQMVNASLCAYEIVEKGTALADAGPAATVMQSRDGFSEYRAIARYQNGAGFLEASPAFAAFGDHHTDGALIGATSDNCVVVALRGTMPPTFESNDISAWVTDWMQDARATPVDWRPLGADYGRVESGFGQAVLHLWPWVKETLAPHVAANPETVFVTGHSKGGAMTYLVASLIREQWPELANKIEVHAFAPAVAVDEAFVRAYDTKGLSARTMRYQVENDVVPFLPFWKEASIWDGISFSGWAHEMEWLGVVEALKMATGGGYSAPGAFTFFSKDHDWVQGAKVADTALPAVVGALMAGEYQDVTAAHSITDSYLNCLMRTEGS